MVNPESILEKEERIDAVKQDGITMFYSQFDPQYGGISVTFDGTAPEDVTVGNHEAKLVEAKEKETIKIKMHLKKKEGDSWKIVKTWTGTTEGKDNVRYNG